MKKNWLLIYDIYNRILNSLFKKILLPCFNFYLVMSYFSKLVTSGVSYLNDSDSHTFSHCFSIGLNLCSSIFLLASSDFCSLLTVLMSFYRLVFMFCCHLIGSFYVLLSIYSIYYCVFFCLSIGSFYLQLVFYWLMVQRCVCHN